MANAPTTQPSTPKPAVPAQPTQTPNPAPQPSTGTDGR